MDAAGVSLGPIGLTIGSDLRSTSVDEEDGAAPSGRPKSYASLTTAEWRELYEKDGAVDLWVQEEFNSGSRLVVSAAGVPGLGVPRVWGWRRQQRGAGAAAPEGVQQLQAAAAASMRRPGARPDRRPRPRPRPGRAQGGSAVWRGGVAGYTTGEGPGLEGAVRHKVRITNRNTGQEMEVEVPEDR